MIDFTRRRLLKQSTAASIGLLPRLSMLEYREVIKAPHSNADHIKSFVTACIGNIKANSPFSIGGELIQVLLLGAALEE